MQRKCPWHSSRCVVTIQAGPQCFSAASAGTESCSIHGLDGQKACSNLSVNAPSFLCPRPELTSGLSRLSARASWLSGSHVLCVIPQRTAFVISARGGYPRAFHCYQESCGDRVIWVTGRSRERSVTYAHTPRVPGKEHSHGQIFDVS